MRLLSLPNVFRAEAFRLKGKFLLLFHTIKYLRARQIFYRFYYQFRKLKLKQLQEPAVTLSLKQSFKGPPKWQEESILNEDKVIFLHEEGRILSQSDWNSPHKSKLWLYHLHYFDALDTNTTQDKTDLFNSWIEKWVRENPPLQGNGWEAYPLSLRIVNWIKWFSAQQISPLPALLGSLALQAEALSKQVEYHLGANHVFVNAKALIFAGSTLSHPSAKRWLKQGLRIFDQECREQFLEDGGHFELSPMYHANLLWDLCDIVNLSNLSKIKALEDRKTAWSQLILKAYHWLDLMSHPDQEPAFFNDSTMGMAPSLQALKNYLQHLGLSLPEQNTKSPFSLSLLKESGYAVVHLAAQGKAILDVAPLGVDYQPGHAHADSLSFELSLKGQRVLVNSGISVYGTGALRHFQRGTKAHNTLCINGENSSEIWAGFRVGRRAYPQGLSIQEGSQALKITCSHTGYLRLKGRNLHQRQWTFLARGLSIQDKIKGPYQHAEVRYYFHPALALEVSPPNTLHCYFENALLCCLRLENALSFQLEETCWYPFFGASQKNHCLVVKVKNGELLTEIEW